MGKHLIVVLGSSSCELHSETKTCPHDALNTSYLMHPEPNTLHLIPPELNTSLKPLYTPTSEPTRHSDSKLAITRSFNASKNEHLIVFQLQISVTHEYTVLGSNTLLLRKVISKWRAIVSSQALCHYRYWLPQASLEVPLASSRVIRSWYRQHILAFLPLGVSLAGSWRTALYFVL
jgi:hypothetical protein